MITICRTYATEGRKAALEEKARPGRVPKLTGEAEAHLVHKCVNVVATAYSAPPEGAARWALKLLRDKMIAEGHVEEISQVALHKRLKKTRSSRGKFTSVNQVKSRCVAKASAKSVAKMEDVLEVYARPYDEERPVVCMDETSKERHEVVCTSGWPRRKPVRLRSALSGIYAGAWVVAEHGGD